MESPEAIMEFETEFAIDKYTDSFWNTQVPRYPARAKEGTSPDYLPLVDYLKEVTSDKNKTNCERATFCQIEKLKAAQQGNVALVQGWEKKRKAAKSNLPFWGLSYAGERWGNECKDELCLPIIVCDIDHPERKPTQIKEIVPSSGLIPAMIVTGPSGDGCRAVVRYNPEQLTRIEAFEALSGYFWAKWGISLDEAMRNAKQGVYGTYDPQPFVAQDGGAVIGKAFFLEYGKEYRTPKQKKEEIAGLQHRVERGNGGIEYEDGQKDCYLYRFFQEAAKAGTPIEAAIKQAEKEFARESFPIGDIRKKAEKEYADVERKNALLQESPEYYRISSTYYRASEDGLLLKWKKPEIMQDKGKYWMRYVKVLDDGFINEPSNTDYQQIIGNQYNIYHRPPIHTKVKEEFPTIMAMLEHICKLSWKVEYLLDYIQICWQNPKQKLPVLVLTSRKQQTGKSSFFNFLQWMFGNTYVGSIEDITGQFTSGWVHSLFICLEESTTDRKAQNNRIKHLATAKTLKLEQKGVDAVQVDFNAKILLANNAEENPIFLEDTDTRYCVLRIGELGQINPNFEEDIKAELGAFIDFLSNRELSTSKQTRLWFSDEVIQTQHTLLAKDSAKPIAEVAIMEIVAAIRSQYPGTEILFRLTELKKWFSYLGYDWKQECVVAVLKRTCDNVSRRTVTVYTCYGDEDKCVQPEKRNAPTYYWKYRS